MLVITKISAFFFTDMKERERERESAPYNFHATVQPLGILEPGSTRRRFVGEAPTRLRTLLRVKTESDASLAAVPSETPLDGRRQPATSSSGE
jgi:hypothetical protein